MMARFPERLFQLLKLVDENGWEDTFSWVNNGTGFKVHDRNKFEKLLLKKHFNTTRYASFARQLHAYGFDCVRAGRQTGIYSHPHFRRDDPIGSSALKREAGRNVSKAAVSRRNQECQDGGLEDHFARMRNFVLSKDAIKLAPLLLERPNASCLPNMQKDNVGTADDGSQHWSVMSNLYDTVRSQVADRRKNVIPSPLPTQCLHFNRKETGPCSGISAGGTSLNGSYGMHNPHKSFWTLSTNQKRATSALSMASVNDPTPLHMIVDEGKSNDAFATGNLICDEEEDSDLDPIPLEEAAFDQIALKPPVEDDYSFRGKNWDPTNWSPAGSVSGKDNDARRSPIQDGFFLEPRPINEMVQDPGCLSTCR
ncbi:unnamed protein product [Cylindrotheca closterium]|uniref:HSF-type DNA-binding domain-containing protein n=1 Tax=Cylindrotheca closterium TaxID=2856 RepID=A0AAD2G1Z8_9STRA|nr:unnamed protein product [Cylindrotheca closterium]